MSLGHPHWRGRRKRVARRLARDLRQLAPLIAIASCFAGSAMAILVAPLVPVAFEAPAAETGGVSLPAVSAEPERCETGDASAPSAAGCPTADVASR